MSRNCGNWQYDPTTGKSVFVENKETHYTTSYTYRPALLNPKDEDHYTLARCRHHPKPTTYPYARQFGTTAENLPPSMQLSAELTSKNSTQQARRAQAALFAREGYHGPIKAGEVIALKNLLTKLNKAHHVVHGWRLVSEKNAWGYTQVKLKGPNYLFKSPIKGLNFDDFIMLARMYRDGKGLKDAVTSLLARLPAELKEEAETFRTVDILAGLGEKS